MSRDGPYLWVSVRASGGMYTKVPGSLDMVWASRAGLRSSIREFPMSVILAVRDEVSRTFLAVRSLWTIGECLPCRYTSPLHVSVRMETLTGSGILGAHSRRSSTLISSLSITSRGSSDPSRKHRPRNCVMLGCRRPAMSWHSRWYFSIVFRTPSFKGSNKRSCMRLAAQETLLYSTCNKQ